jgi:AcrR family transcriptional regulator
MMGRKPIAEIRREEIIDAFYKVVSEKGFANATVREVARVAGCSYRMLHHYFANKEEIIVAFIKRLTEENIGQIRKQASEFTTFSDRRKYLWSVASDAMPALFSLEICRAWIDSWALAKTHPEVSEALQEYYNGNRNLLAEFVREGIKMGEFRKVDPEIAASLILAVLEGIMVIWVVNRDGLQVEAICKEFPEWFNRYLMPDK